MPSIPDPVLEPGWEQDSTSLREAEYWPNYDHIGSARKANTLKIHKAVGWCIPIGIVAAFAAFMLASGIYLTHLIGPHCIRWLSTEEISQLHNMLFSGLVGAAVTQAARVYMSKKD